MAAPTWDMARAKANIALVKMTLTTKALQKDPKTGLPKRIFYCFLPGKTKSEHIFLLHHQKKAAKLLEEARKLAPDRKVFSCGTALLIVEGSKKQLFIKQVEKKMPMVETKMKEALAFMNLQYLPKPDDGKIKAIDPKEDEEDEEEDEPKAVVAKAGAAAAGAAKAGAAAAAAGAAKAGAAAAGAAKSAAGLARGAGVAAVLKAVAAPKPSSGAIHLEKAPALWKTVHQSVHGDCQKVMGHVRAHYKDHGAAVMAEIEKGLKKVETITSQLDHSLANALEQVAKAKDHAAQVKALGEAKRIHGQFRTFVKGEPMIKHMDSNPWAPTQIGKKLELSLSQIEKTIADMAKELAAAAKG